MADEEGERTPQRQDPWLQPIQRETAMRDATQDCQEARYQRLDARARVAPRQPAGARRRAVPVGASGSALS
jgi:hypothetical protein